MKREARFPTIIGIIILLLGLAVGVILTGRRAVFFPRASGDCSPTSFQVTNLTNSSADISFATETPCLISLNIDRRIVADVRSQYSPAPSSKTHYYQVNNLSPNTEYQFSLVAQGEIKDSPEYKFRTAPAPASAMPESNLAWGRVYHPDLSPAAGSIVYLLIADANPLSALVTSSGNWNISLSVSFKLDGSGRFVPPADQAEDFIVLSPDGQLTQIISNTSQNTPVPDIILGQNSFTSSPVAPADDLPPQSVGPPPSSQDLTISNPSEGELVNSLKPQFMGFAPANSRLTIKIESPLTVNGQTVAGQGGNWAWSPPDDLSPGEHTITVTTTNPQTGLVETLIRKFIVLASSDQPAFTASSSAAIIITPSPTPTDIILSPPPTATTIPTSIPGPSPTSSETPNQPTNTPPVPVTGNTTPLIITLGLATILITSSILVLF